MSRSYTVERHLKNTRHGSDIQSFFNYIQTELNYIQTIARSEKMQAKSTRNTAITFFEHVLSKLFFIYCNSY